MVKQGSLHALSEYLDEKSRYIFGLLLLLAILVYANSFPGTFVLDDIHIAKNNPLVKDVDLLTIFHTDYWHGMENSGLFRPLTIFSLAINRLIFGTNAWGFHLVNLLLHAGVTLLFWQTLKQWTIRPVVAFLAAALFAVHPLHTEVVDVIVGRSELLVALFLLLAFLSLRKEGSRWQYLAVLFYFAALLSKENAITFLLLLPVAEAFCAERFTIWKERWRLYAGLATATVVWLLWRTYGVTSDLPRSTLTEAAAPLAHVDTLTRVLSALEHQWIYLKLHLWPIPLQSVYSIADLPPFLSTFFSFTSLAVVTATSIFLALIVYGVKRKVWAAFFLLLYVLSFAITANLFFPIGVTMAERLTYLPSLWFSAALAALLLGEGRTRLQNNLGAIVGCLFILFFATVCLARNVDYGSEPQLWMEEVRQNPQDYLGWQNVGEVLTNHKRYVEAEAAYLQMLRLNPDYPGGLRSWTFFLLTQDRHAEALESARRAHAISEKKGERVAVAFDSMDMAESLLALGRYAEALAVLQPAGTILSRVSRYNELRARVFNALGRDEEALAAFSKVQTIAPGSNLHYKLALSLYRLNRLDEAHAQLKSDIEVRRGSAEVYNLIGVIEARQEKWAAALDAFGRAIELEPDNSYYRENYERAKAAK